ncbi:MAG: bifunctional SulP family inorganic anion transporter/carbonic anhydrase [Cryomorphaceae bacterium]|nr:sulfate transporter [Flavobacteriales bacterium]
MKSGLDRFEKYLNKVDSVEDDRSMFGYLSKDIPASIVVFLVALPLCLGIALASGAPLASGLIAGVVGGLVVGYISKSGTSVSGPAASVSAIALSAIVSLGSYDLFLVSVCLSGLMQIALGKLNAGLIADYMPTSIIKGLLAGIGVILIISQFPYAIGLDIPEEGFIMDHSTNQLAKFSEVIPRVLDAFSPGAIFISVISLAVIIFWNKSPLKNLKWFPSSLFVVILGVILNLIFQFFIPSLHLSGSALVEIPSIDKLNEFFILPDYRGLLNFEVWTVAVTIAVVASIATLLNIEATDNLDPYKRKTPPNRELVAQGIGNTISGLVGGLPVTSVIVRSSVNINAGAETKLSTILHGLLLIASVLFLSTVINLIPLASLAVILIVTGYKLTSLQIIRKLYKKGWDQFIPFVITVVGIVTLDLLIGILIGTGVAVFFLLKGNYHNPFFIENMKSLQGQIRRIELSNEVSFLNKASIKNMLWNTPNDSNLVIDATYSSFIDKDVLEIIEDFRDTFAVEHGINVRVVGLKDAYKTGSAEDFLNSGEQPFFREIDTPENALDALIEGNKRYSVGDLLSRRQSNRKIVNGQTKPAFAAIAACVDLRESIHILFDAEVGQLVTVKSLGNSIGSELIQNLEAAVKTQKIKIIVFLGHSGNSIIRSAVADKNGDGVDLKLDIHKKLPGKKSLEALSATEKWNLINEITQENVRKSATEILKKSKYLRSEVEKGNMGIATGFLDRETGEISLSLIPYKD